MGGTSNGVMFLIVHATVGAMIGDNLEPPAVGFLAGLLSHFFLDAIPHGDELLERELARPGRIHWLAALAILDGLAAISLVVVLWLGGFLNNAAGAFGGAVGAILPDVFLGLSELSKKKLWPDFLRFHDWNHRIINIELSLYFGGLIQAAVLLIVLRLFGLTIF
ncbi:hypothetical protein A3I40_03740 [Candidatus Uhrbacteria bacterium RIFCSPLOWO2_02_FULL_48_12]|uniref:Uncharacterized protein n=1 Tax=Candidatus Uhrbacteria bacterium RIFCSPLOWO2_02_FULL_48_12 TaxID=1802407 RepID=A0A1F7V9U7_9BACT|nr:MAG: hypothetical protein A3I40_03740 [Candidatus Uhrbacteria bacterium RIFCSPLOWO2_02_FULL_48_12]